HREQLFSKLHSPLTPITPASPSRPRMANEEKSEKQEQTVFDDRNDKPFPEHRSISGSKEGSKEKLTGTVRTVPRPAALPNKPWEPAFKLKLNPPDYIKMRWQKGVSVFSEMTITNTLSTPQCYKMKCTDNTQFRVRPPMNFIDQGASVTVKIIHNSYVLPEPNKHYFALYHIKCTPEDLRNRNFKRIWRAQTPPDGVIRVPVAFGTAEIKVSNGSGPAPSSTMTGKGVSRPMTFPPVVGGRTKSVKKK
ncbi:hypothetical protein PMAYCL1PPCAC_19047, partial [Pristionchus mayeri]